MGTPTWDGWERMTLLMKAFRGAGPCSPLAASEACVCTPSLRMVVAAGREDRSARPVLCTWPTAREGAVKVAAAAPAAAGVAAAAVAAAVGMPVMVKPVCGLAATAERMRMPPGTGAAAGATGGAVLGRAPGEGARA